MKLLLSTTMFLASICYAQTFTEIFKATAFDREAEDRLGFAVDISGDYAIAGAYGDDFGTFDPNMGSAYIFEKTGIEDWRFVQKINNSDQDDYDRFGDAVALHGNFAVIGAFGEDEDENDENNLSKAGSVYVFERGADGVWSEMQKLVPDDRQAGDEFGWSVDIYDSTIVVGAHHHGYDEDGGDFEYHAGAIYIFELDAVDGTWSQTQKMVPSDRSDDHVYPGGRPDPTDEDVSDLFGGSVAIWGDYLIAGSHNHDYGPSGVGTGYRWNSGAAYLFERSGGTWTEVEKLQPTVRKAWDRFGYAVDLDSNIVLVGSYTEDESEFEAASLMNAGAAYIFERDGTGDWTQIQKLDASDRTAGDHFGRDVAIAGDYLVIGAEQEDLNEDGDPSIDSISNAGAAYIFEKDDDGVWSEIQKIVNSHRDEGDYFGEAVSISEHTIFAGAWQQDYDSLGADYTEDAGAAYFYSAIVCGEEFTEQDISICAGETFEVGESSYSVSGEYVDTLLNVDACDSIVTTNLTVIEPVHTEQDISVCSGTSFTVGDNTYDETGTYTDSLVSVLTGCDSIVTTNLTVIEPVHTEQDISVCSGTSFTVGDNTYDETGTYTDSLVSVLTGCDSIVTTVLTVEPPIEHSQEIHLCFGETFIVGDSEYDESGLYLDSLTTDEGCDSLVTTDLFIEDENTFEQSLTICAGEFVTVGESVYTESGEYVDVLESATGCDSTVTTELEVLPEIDVTVETDAITLTGGDPDVEPTSFQWIKCDPYEVIDGATEREYTVVENGDYAVIITIDECTDTSECVTISEVGTETFTTNFAQLYPNPNNGQFTVSIADYHQGLNLNIVNHLGETVYRSTITKSLTDIDLDHIAKGSYFVRITDGNAILVKKLIIQ